LCVTSAAAGRANINQLQLEEQSSNQLQLEEQSSINCSWKSNHQSIAAGRANINQSDSRSRTNKATISNKRYIHCLLELNKRYIHSHELQ